MRGKHHYKIIKTIYKYVGDDYLEGCKRVSKEIVLCDTNKRAIAERVYYNNLWQECGTELKGIYYPSIGIAFIRDY